MASYSVPDSRGVMYPLGGNGRWFISFINPNGTVTGMWQNTNATFDTNWVAPPAAAWDSWGVHPDYITNPASVQGNIQSVAPTIFTSGQDTGYHGPSGPVVSFDQYMAIKNQQIAANLATVHTSANTGATTNTTNTNAASTDVTGTASSDPVFGLFGDTSAEVLGVAHEYTLIGIVALLAVGYMMTKGR